MVTADNLANEPQSLKGIAMGTYILEAHPGLGEADKVEVNALIKEFMGKKDKAGNSLAKAYLNKNGADEVVYVTNDPNLLKNANILTLKRGRVTVSQPLEKKDVAHWGLQQDAYTDPDTKKTYKKTIYINMNQEAIPPQLRKPPLNILIHEIGHLQWRGLGETEDHQPFFYRLLSDTLKSFGIEPKQNLDLYGHPNCELNSIEFNANSLTHRQKRGDPFPSPMPDEECQALIKASAPKKITGQYEGLRYLHTPKVVSINPSVNLTPMGGAVVPVPYTVVGYFDESINTTRSVRFTSDQVFTMTSYVREVHGDAPGSAGGIKSGTVSATAEPIEHSVNVRAERFHIVRHDDLFYMNNRNTIGRAIFIVSSGDQENTA